MTNSLLLPTHYQAVLRHAAQQFNQHAFWHCHETLEPLWLNSAEPYKTVLQGLIQLAAAYVHIQQQNRKGALQLFEKALPKLHVAPTQPDIAHWLDWPALLQPSEALYTQLQRVCDWPEPMAYPVFTVQP